MAKWLKLYAVYTLST